LILPQTNEEERGGERKKEQKRGKERGGGEDFARQKVKRGANFYIFPN